MRDSNQPLCSFSARRLHRIDMVCDSKPPQSKKVCVVGAGMAGLAAARELRREGHAVTVLEQSGDVGGQWLYDPRTDHADPLGAAAPVRRHSSIYESVRLISARETMGFSDFPFAPRDGGDPRRFPGHREVHRYLKDFCAAFGLADAVRLNTRVLRVSMAPATRKWAVRSVGTEGDKEEVFDAVVVATGHYSQPRLPSIDGMERWTGRQLHSHSYRAPEPFRGEAVVVVGCGESGKDIAMELLGVAREVILVANSMESVTPGLSKVLAKHSSEMRLRLRVERLCEDGRVAFADGSSVVADSVIYCTGFKYSFPFLDTAGAVEVHDDWVEPLFEHIFPPSLSFIGIPRKIFVPWFLEVQSKWVAQVLSGKRTLPPEEEMLRSLEEWHRTRVIAGAPKKHTHEIGAVDRMYMDKFGEKYCDFPPVERWKYELLLSSLANMVDNLETFRDDYQDTDSIRKGVKAWLLSARQQAADAAAEQTVAGLP